MERCSPEIPFRGRLGRREGVPEERGRGREGETLRRVRRSAQQLVASFLAISIGGG